MHVSQAVPRDTTLHNISSQTLFVYNISSASCDDGESQMVNFNHAWEPRALRMVTRALTLVEDPALADWFLVNACLGRFYLNMRDSANPASRAAVAAHNLNKTTGWRKAGTYKDCKACLQFEAWLVKEMARTGPYWVQRPHRHIVTHMRCPREGRATYPFGPSPIIWLIPYPTTEPLTLPYGLSPALPYDPSLIPYPMA